MFPARPPAVSSGPAFDKPNGAAAYSVPDAEVAELADAHV
jgi:hypothetical protein